MIIQTLPCEKCNSDGFILVTSRKLVCSLAKITDFSNDEFYLDYVEDSYVSILYSHEGLRSTVYSSNAHDNIFRYLKYAPIFGVSVTILSCKKLCVDIYLNCDMLIGILRDGKPLPFRHYLITDIERITRVRSSFQGDIPIRIVDSSLRGPLGNAHTFSAHKINGLENLPFHDFQIRKINWMRQVESTSLPIPDTNALTRFKHLYDDVYIDIDNYNFTNQRYIDSQMNDGNHIRGGFLLDSPGLGKTLTILGLCHCDYRGKPNIILCAGEVCRHWQNEIHRVYKNPRVRIICDKKSYQSLTIDEMENLDFVIVSIAFVKGSVYNNCLYDWKCDYTYDTQLLSQAYHSLLAEQLHFNVTKSKGILKFHRITWNRLIIDDCESNLPISSVSCFIRFLDVKYKWITSGLNHVNPISLDMMKNMLDVLKVGNSTEPNTISLNKNIFDTILLKICSRDTFMSIKGEIEEQPIVLDDEVICMSDDELWYYYDTTTDKSFSDKCTFPTFIENGGLVLFDSCDSFESARKFITQDIVRKENQLRTELRFLTECGDDISTHDLLKDIEQCRAMREFVVDDEKEFKNCPICLEGGDNDRSMAMTVCGHMFCLSCILHWNAQTKTCPECRMSLKRDKIIKVDSRETFDNTNRLRSVFGSKIAHCISYIRNLERKVIVFLKTEKSTRKFQKILTDVGIRNLRCFGTEQQRSSAISRFNDNDSKYDVILMSTANMCGARFPNCHNIIIMEYFYESISEKLRSDELAISKVRNMNSTQPIYIKRFILNHTVEYQNFMEISNGREPFVVEEIDDDEFDINQVLPQ